MEDNDKVDQAEKWMFMTKLDTRCTTDHNRTVNNVFEGKNQRRVGVVELLDFQLELLQFSAQVFDPAEATMLPFLPAKTNYASSLVVISEKFDTYKVATRRVPKVLSILSKTRRWRRVPK